MRCGRATLGADTVVDGMTFSWDRIGVRQCGARSAVAGMMCGGVTHGTDSGICFGAAWRRRAKGARCTGARRTLEDGAR